MKVVELSSLDPLLWDETADASASAWLFHRSAWVNLEARYFAAANHSFAVVGSDRKPVAICPLYLRELGRGRWLERVLDSGHHRIAGYALRDGLAAATRAGAISTGMRHLTDLARKLDVDRIQLGHPSLAPAFRDVTSLEPPFWVQDYGFHLGLHIGPQGDLAVPGLATVCADQLLDLRVPEEVLFSGLEVNFRNAVRKARTNALTFVRADQNAVADYYALAQQSAQRTQEHLRPIAMYQTLWDSLVPASRCAVFFALAGDVRVAGLMVLLDKKGMHYFGGVSHPDYLQMRVNNFIQWEAICWARQQGYEWYRLGPIFPDLPKDWPVAKVSWFKGCLGAKSRLILQGSLFRHPERYLEDAREATALRCQPQLPAAVADAAAPTSAPHSSWSPFAGLRRACRPLTRFLQRPRTESVCEKQRSV